MENIVLLGNMLNLQHKLNVVTCGPDWTSGLTNKERVINWRRYTRMELAELIDSSSRFKHWKDLDGDVNWDNMKMEVVDVWHFIMSDGLSDFTVEEIINICKDFLPTDESKLLELNYFNTVDIAENLMEATFRTGPNTLENILHEFFKLLYSVGMSYGDLYKQYIVKNTLNTFRQNNGYKEGTYVKVIDGAEDNVHIMNLANDNPGISPESLYETYETYYKNFKDA